MAVFMDTGNGDIYGGPSKEAILECIRKETSDFDESRAFEVPGSMKLRDLDENEEDTGELVSLEDEYCEHLGVYEIATNN